MIKVFVAIVVSGLVFASCLEEEIDRSPRATSPPSTAVFIATPTPTVVPAMSDVEVKRALVTLTDLPSTWYNADSREPAESDAERCDLPNPFLANPPVADATETFASSQTGPWIAESIFQMQTTEHAQSLMEDLRRSFECGTWTHEIVPEPTPTPDPAVTPEPTASPDPNATPTEPEPTEITWDIAQPDELDLRNGAFVTRMISNTAVPIEYELVFVRENNLVILVGHWAREGVNNDITMSIVDRSLEKLDATFAG